MNKNKEISNCIAKEFASRMEASVFTYILDKGCVNLINITDQEINEIEGNGFMSATFVQALVRTAVKICKKYTPMEIMEYIRIECNFSPFPKSITLYKDFFTDFYWEELCEEFDIEDDEQEINVLVINNSDSI